MRKIKVFARTFWKSLTDPAYYKDILSAKFSFSLKYLFSLLLLVSLISGIDLAVRVIRLTPKVPGFVENAKKFIVTNFPQDLSLTVKAKKITSSVKEPYFIDLPVQTAGSEKTPKHFLAIATKKQPDDFPGLDSMFVLTADSLVVYEGDAGYRKVPLENFLAKVPEGVVVDKNNLKSILENSAPFFVDLIPKILMAGGAFLLILYPPLRAVFGLATQMIFLLPVSLLLFVFAKLARRQISYLKTYQFCLHGLTVPVILSFVLGPFLLNRWGPPFVWLAFLAFMVWVILRFNRPATE